MRMIGTVARGIRTPIIREGDDLASMVVESLQAASKEGGFSFHDRDVLCMTEAIVARAQGNYASVDQIAQDIRKKFPGGVVGLFNPIFSRNRFSMNLKAIARAMDKIYLQMTYPSDEVGNQLITVEEMDKAGLDPYNDILSEEGFYQIFGEVGHPFTGVDYIKFYRDIVEAEDCELVIFLANQPKALLEYTDQVITCDIHTKERSKRRLKAAGAKVVYGLDDIMTQPVDGSGCNEEYGLLGSNKASEEKVKLFPRDCQNFVDGLADQLKELTGKNIEVMIYGDGGFKDPRGGIWEFADPVVSPGFTHGLSGLPNELKLKYLADNDFADLKGEELRQAIAKKIEAKDKDLKGAMESEGTTPRHLTDLLGSLADLVSGSGDKGTPVVFIQGYFDNFTTGLED